MATREEELKNSLDARFPPKQFISYNDYVVMRDMICQLQLEGEQKDGIIAGLKASGAKKDARIKWFEEGNTRLANAAPLSDADIAPDFPQAMDDDDDDDANYADYTDDTEAETETNRRRSVRLQTPSASTSAITSLTNLQPQASKTRKRKNNNK